MTTFERRQRLLALLKAQPGVRVPEAARLLNVSDGTVRNDLNALAEEGLLARVRGGARLSSDFPFHAPAFTARSEVKRNAKLCIAQHAAEFVQDGDSLLLDSSTTVYYMAAHLQKRRGLTVFTNGIEVGRELAKNTSHTVILLGGMLRSDGMSVNVPFNEHILSNLHIKTAFVSSSGFSPEAGLTEVDIHEAQFKRKMITCASTVIALIDSSKFGKLDITAFAHLEQIAHIFTDDGVGPVWLKKLQTAGVAVTVCPTQEN